MSVWVPLIFFDLELVHPLRGFEACTILDIDHLSSNLADSSWSCVWFLDHLASCRCLQGLSKGRRVVAEVYIFASTKSFLILARGLVSLLCLHGLREFCQIVALHLNLTLCLFWDRLFLCKLPSRQLPLPDDMRGASLNSRSNLVRLGLSGWLRLPRGLLVFAAALQVLYGVPVVRAHAIYTMSCPWWGTWLSSLPVRWVVAGRRAPGISSSISVCWSLMLADVSGAAVESALIWRDFAAAMSATDLYIKLQYALRS